MIDWGRAISDVRRRVMMALARGVVQTVQDGPKMQTLQASFLADEIRSGMEHPQNYGFTSNPHPGAECVAAFLGGNRDHGVVLVVDDRRYRLKALAPGEVAIYTDEGDKIVLKRNRVIEFTTNTLIINAATKVEVNTPAFEVNASAYAKFTTPDVQATATITADGDLRTRAESVDHLDLPNEGTMQGIRDIYNQHTHISATPGAPTSIPDDLM